MYVAQRSFHTNAADVNSRMQQGVYIANIKCNSDVASIQMLVMLILECSKGCVAYKM